MDGVMAFLIVMALALTVANMRNALHHTSALRARRLVPRKVLYYQGFLMARNALLASGGLVMALFLLAPDAAHYLAPADRLLLFGAVAVLVFSQLFEQWAMRLCNRLVYRRGLLPSLRR